MLLNNHFISFGINDFDLTKQQVLSWANRFSTCCFLDNHHYNFDLNSYECLAGVGCNSYVEATASNGSAFADLENFRQKNKGWAFGHLGYDLKNDAGQLTSSNPDYIGFADLFFFVPQTVISIKAKELSIAAADEKQARQIFDEISKTPLLSNSDTIAPANINLQARISKQEYINKLQHLHRHILRGDCYEINFCQEFYAQQASINTVETFQALGSISPSPFAAYYKHNDRYLLCASPERYLKKTGRAIFSQPVKGTAARNNNANTDLENRLRLYNSAKERSENVMVVDLVRNDLAKICTEGSVTVAELFGIYSFPQVHQMVSTITGRLKDDIGFADIIKETFPMGSMTGAPKKKVMELIEQYETTKRGIFSGSVGYIEPGGDFDFNVVIRSILYNAQTQYLSCPVGSGITFYADAEQEYQECLLKISAIKNVLKGG